jgi:aspartate kinase
MAEAGAKVLNAEAVEFAKRAGIRIYARATAGSDRQTVVAEDAPRAEGGVRAVVSEKNVARVRIRGNGKTTRAVLVAAREAAIPVKELHAFAGPKGGDARSAFVVALANVPDWGRGRERLVRAGEGAVEIDEGLGALALIGEGLGREPETLHDALETCEAIGAAPVGIATTSFRISLLVPREKLEDAVRACHAKFLG